MMTNEEKFEHIKYVCTRITDAALDTADNLGAAIGGSVMSTAFLAHVGGLSKEDVLEGIAAAFDDFIEAMAKVDEEDAAAEAAA